jgi:hypothetical protein
LLLAAVVALGSCDAELVSPTPTVAPVGSDAQVWIDASWTATNGVYRFTGGVDPDGLPTRVVFETGPGPVTATTFEEASMVVDEVSSFTPLGVELALPQGVETCVRFTIVSEAGRISSQPVCVRGIRMPGPSPTPSG